MIQRPGKIRLDPPTGEREHVRGLESTLVECGYYGCPSCRRAPPGGGGVAQTDVVSDGGKSISSRPSHACLEVAWRGRRHATIARTRSGEAGAIAKQAAADAATGRFTRAEEVASLVALLASDRAGKAIGADIVIDGGLLTTL